MAIPLRDKSRHYVVNDSIHHGIVCEKSYEAHFTPAVGTAGAGEFAGRLAAIEIPPYNLPDNRPEEVVILLEAALILIRELVKIVEGPAVNNGVL